MDFEFSEDQEALRDSVRRFLAREAPVTPYVRSMLDDERGTSDAVWKGLAELGVTGLLVPEDLGGAGRGMVDMGVVLEEMGRAVHPGPFLSSAITAVSAIGAVATEDEQGELLPSLADGSVVATLAAGPVAAERDILTGSVGHVPDGAVADLFLVAAHDGGGTALFTVDRDAPGLTVTPVPTVDGTRKQATLDLDATPGRRLGHGDATAALGGARDRTLAALVTDGVGVASVALEMAVAYAKERAQFDHPIGSFQAVQHLCADMLLALEQGRAGAYFALWACDAVGPAERHRAATMAKAFAGDAFFRIGASAVQVFGGVGFTWEHDVHLFYKRLLSLQQAHGTTREHLEELASIIL